MSEQAIEFKIKPFYWIYSLVIAGVMAIWSLYQFIMLVAAQETIFALTAISGLFMAIAFLVVALRHRNGAALIISRDTLTIMGACYPIAAIRYIELNDPKKITFWVGSGTSEYRKKLNLKFIRAVEHAHIHEALTAINGKIKEGE